MNKIYNLLILLFILPIQVFSQEIIKPKHISPDGVVRCLTTEVSEYQSQVDPIYQQSQSTFEEWLQPIIQNKKTLKTKAGVIQIPVVVHVIHDGDMINAPGKIYGENISYAQALSQINVLNEDFRRISGSPGANISGYGRGVDTEIQFVLANIAPDGSPTNGINRVNMCEESWSLNQIEQTVKPNTIWDPTQYFNIWTIKFVPEENDYLGYAQFPVQSGLDGIYTSKTAETDGVVMNYMVFGTEAENDGSFVLKSDYDLGRSTTHEVGHWLGLVHIWGDGGCDKDDYCADTPLSDAANYGCPTGHESCGSVDMVENYMDYTDDACMNTFTADQKTRMRTVLQNSPRRKELVSSNALNISNIQLDAELQLNCGTNPIESLCNRQSGVQPQVEIYNNGPTTVTSLQIQYGINGGNYETFNWSGSISQFEIEKIQLPSISNATTTGTNEVYANIIAVNGIKDEISSNNNDVENYIYQERILNNYSETNFIFEFTPDNYPNEFSWEIINSQLETVVSGGNYPESTGSLITKQFTLPDNDCYTLIVRDNAGDGICCDFGNGNYLLKTINGDVIVSNGQFGDIKAHAFTVGTLSLDDIQSSKLKVYPNPSNGILNIDFSAADGNEYIEIYDLNGKKIFHQEYTDTIFDLKHLSKGIYILRLIDDKATYQEKIIIQ